MYPYPALFSISQNSQRLFLAVLCTLVSALPKAMAFTQSGAGTDLGNGVPMGHEWVTRMAALELLGGDPIMKADPSDPRSSWHQGLAKNIDLSGSATEVQRLKSWPYSDGRYQSTYKFVYDAIVGERWVDIAGFNVTNSSIPGNINCFDAVAQEPVEVQFDHYMRRYNDVGGAGANEAIVGSQQRFMDYFIAAATAPQMSMQVWDGGGYSVLTTVDRNYFLFGRAIHLFEDSFSSEHSVRIPDDNFVKVRQIKSYLCAKGSEQHNHSNLAMFDYSSGDVVWIPGTRPEQGWASYKPSNMKTVALVAEEATKDLWAAFIRTMATPANEREAKARQEALTLVENWLKADAAEVVGWYNNQSHRDGTYVFNDGESGVGQSQSDCMKKLGIATGKQEDKVAQLQSEQRLCLYNVLPEDGYTDLFDTAFHMPFNWKWKSHTSWTKPPSDWVIPNRPAVTGSIAKIKNAFNNKFMTTLPALPTANQYVFVTDSSAASAFDFITVTDSNGTYFRLRNRPDLFLSYTAVTGQVKLLDSAWQASYKLEHQADGSYSIKNTTWNQYLWLDKTTPYISRSGKPSRNNAHWHFVMDNPL